MEAAASSCRRPRTQSPPVRRRRRHPLRRRSAIKRSIKFFSLGNFQSQLLLTFFLFWESFQRTTARLHVSLRAGRGTLNKIYISIIYKCKQTLIYNSSMEQGTSSTLHQDLINFIYWISYVVIFLHFFIKAAQLLVKNILKSF